MRTQELNAVPRGASATPTWQQALREAIRDPDVLIDRLGLDDGLRPGARRAAALFPLLVPASYLARMRPGDPSDPLLRQVLPLADEALDVAGYSPDPVGDRAALRAPGLLQKYAGRALLLATGTCAVHCRFCFRRHFPYDELPRGIEAWRPALDALAQDREVQEAILSGGDPLVLADAQLQTLMAELAALPHLRRLRLHTRLPIVIPERVTAALPRLLRDTRLTPFVVLHANHAAELVGDCARAIARLADAGIPLLNQSVLLRGVNDDVESQASLCERLVELRVLPYYLHQLDRVQGAAHFHVPEARGRAILADLERRLPGYALPRYVREVPGAASKLAVGMEGESLS